MSFRITFLFCFLSTIIFAQTPKAAAYQFACKSGFYQLMDNQLHLLSNNKRGEMAWFPVLEPFKRPIKVISYNLDDGFMYAIDTMTNELLRIYKSGTMHALGRPKHETSGEFLQEQFSIGEIGGGFFCLYAPAEKELYWLDMEKMTYSTSPPLIEGQMVHLAYHAQEEVFYTVSTDARIYTIDPFTHYVKQKNLMSGFPSGPFNSGGNLWLTKDQRIFATRKNGTFFYELNESTGTPYNSKITLPEVVGDGTSCSDAYPPAFVENDVFEMRLDLPNNDRTMLRWTGVHEFNNDYYIVEQSLDDRFWIAKDLKPSSGPHIYQNPYGSMSSFDAGGINYYRLKKVNSFGNVAYSRTVMLNLDEGQSHLILSPQIALNNHALALYVSNYEGTILGLEIVDVLGTVIDSDERIIQSPEITLSLDIESLNTGYYCLKIRTAKDVVQKWFWVNRA